MLRKGCSSTVFDMVGGFVIQTIIWVGAIDRLDPACRILNLQTKDLFELLHIKQLIMQLNSKD